MRVEYGSQVIELGATETTPTIGITDFSRREVDAFGATTIVRRGFARTLSVRLALPAADASALQQTLGDLRATPVRWVADDRYDWLSATGFYRDFSIDHGAGALAFCTLSVVGLAEDEAAADSGADPSTDGKVSTFRMLDPIAITDAVLTSSSVLENDQPPWSAGTSYAAGARVIVTATHRVYESLVAGNVGNVPAVSPDKWLDVGPTNRWAMFDQALGTATTASGSITLTLHGSQANALALLDVGAASVRVLAPGYDRTIAVAAGPVAFLDLPASDGAVSVAITGTGPVSVGTLLLGRLAGLGVTEASPSSGINDFSVKETDDFGDVTVVERAWAKRLSANTLIRTDAIDDVAGRIAAQRARPVLWIADEGTDALIAYGFWKDFSIEVGPAVSKVALSIEGLTKANPLPEPAALATSVVAEGSVDGVSWHLGLEPGDIFLRISNDSGATYGPAVRIAGETGDAGEDGAYQQQIFRRAATRPATPMGGGIPAGWADGVPDGSDPVWISVQYQRNGVALGAWSLPSRISGPPGENAPLVVTQWSVDGVSGWHADYVDDSDKFQRQSSDNGITWGPPVRVVGESASAGQDGVSPSIIFTRSATVPATPARDTGNPPPGWYDAPPVGTDLLWQSASRFRAAAQLQDWSIPVRITGPQGTIGATGAGSFTLLDFQNCHSPGPNFVTKRAGSGWDAKAVTAERYVGGATVSAKMPWATFIGLDTSTGEDASYTSIQYALHISASGPGNVGVYRNGANVFWSGGVWTVSTNTRGWVTHDDKTVRYFIEGRGQIYEHAVDGPGEMLNAVFALDTGVPITEITFAAGGRAGVNGLNAPLVRTQWSIDGSTAWHDNYFGADRFYRTSNDNGATWGPAIRGVGEGGAPGPDGISPITVFVRQTTVPGAPADNTGYVPPGWSDGPPGGAALLWMSKASFRGATQLTSWSTPQRISGEDGPRGADGGSSFTLLDASCLGVTSPTSVRKHCAGDGWTAKAHTRESGRAVMVSALMSPAQFVSLTTDPGYQGENDYSTLDYAIHWTGSASGEISIWRNGVPEYGWSRPHSSGPVRVTIVADGKGNVTFSADGVFGPTVRPAHGANEELFAAFLVHNSGDSITGIKFAINGVDGAAAIVVQLTNEHFTVPTDTAGNYAAFPTDVSRGNMKVYEGGIDVTSASTFTVMNPYALDSRTNADGSYYAIGLYADTGYSDLVASYKGRAYSARLTAAKNRAGANGVNPPTIAINAAPQQARYNKNDALITGDIVVSTVRQNTDEVPRFELVSFDGTQHGFTGTAAQLRDTYSNGTFDTTGPDNLILKASWINAVMQGYGGGLRVRAHLTTTNDVTTIQKIRDGSNGNDGKDGLVAAVSPPAIVIPAYSGGAPKPSWMGGSFVIRLQKGGQEITAGVTYTYVGATNISSPSMSGQTFSFAGISDERGEVTLRATFAGVNYDQRVSVTKVRDGSAAFTGVYAAAGNTDGTMAVGSVTVPANRNVVITAGLNYTVDSSTYGDVIIDYGIATLYWRNASAGGPWNYLGQQNGSNAGRIAQPPDAEGIVYYETYGGEVQISYGFVSPSPDSQIEFRVDLAKSGSSGLYSLRAGGVLQLEVQQ